MSVIEQSKNTDESEKEDFLDDEPADFEKAIAATGFGKFNFFLVLISIPSMWAPHFETTVMSYVFPAAQCDLNLTIEDKGLLNAVTYAGTITSSFFWGLLSDNFGRRSTLMTGFLLNGLVVFINAFSPNKYMLMFLQYVGGFLVSGPYAALATYCSEFHIGKYRSRVPLILGVLSTLGGIYLPVLGAWVFPSNFHTLLFGFLPFSSWRLFVLLNSFPALIAGFGFIFLPESPRYLLSKGKNLEAMEVFKKIYSINTGRPPPSYPIKRLVEEIAGNSESNKKSIAEGLTDGYICAKKLLAFPYLKTFLLVCSLQMSSVMSYSTLRLWMPQLFQGINDFKFLNNRSASSICEILNVIRPSNRTSKSCFVNVDVDVYIRTTITAISPLVTYSLAGALINAVGQKRLLSIVAFLFGCVACGIYIAPSEDIITFLMSLFRGLGCLGSNITIVIVVNLFPTSLRAMTVGLSHMCGRLAAMFGHVIFPYLIKLGCEPPFILIGGLGFICSFLAWLAPREKKILL